MRTLKPPFSDPRYELIDPKVQRHGEVALLTFNLVNYGKLADGAERELARWNSTEAYAPLEGTTVTSVDKDGRPSTHIVRGTELRALRRLRVQAGSRRA